MTRRTRITLAAAAGLMLSLDALGAVLLVPPALRSLDSGRARSLLQTTFRVSRALSRAALVVEKNAHRRQRLRLVTWSGACCGKTETTLTQ